MYGDKLKLMRKNKGLTQSELSLKSGVSKRLIQVYESGERSFNDVACLTIVKLSDALECDIHDILDDY